MAETKKTKKKAPAAKAGGKKACTVQGCKRAYRAKGLCFFHYKKWRRSELEAKPARYETCSKADCKKKVFQASKCSWQSPCATTFFLHSGLEQVS